MYSSVTNGEAFIDTIKTQPEQPVLIHNLVEFIEFIVVINDFFLQILYRGQADTEWGINSYAYRQLNNPTQDDLYKYHSSLVLNSKYLHEENLNNLNKVSDLVFLTYLQHHGAKTNLIDFTENPLVALWFACSDCDEKDGQVCWKSGGFESVSESKNLENIFNDETQKIYKFTPSLFDRRIMAQRSVFLFPPNGKIESHQYRKITIPAASKKYILRDLELIGISQKTLFPDFSGFVEWFNYNGKDRLEALLEEGDILVSETNYLQAIKIYLEAEKISEKIFGENDPRNAFICKKIGMTYNNLKRDSNDLDLAMKYHLKAMSIQEKVFGIDNPETAKSYNNIALQFRQRDKFDDAIAYYKKVEKIRLKHYGLDHPDTSSLYNNLGFLYYFKDDFDSAMIYYNKCREIREKATIMDTLAKATIYSNIAKVYIKQDKLIEAKQLLDKALDIRKKIRGEDHLTTAAAYFLSAQVELALHHYDNASSYLEKAFKIRKDQRGEQSKLVGDCYNIEAKIAFARGNFEEALSVYQKAQNIRECIFGEKNSDTAMIYEGIAETNLKLERFSEAKKYADLALNVYKRVFGLDSQKVKRMEMLIKDISER